MMQIPLSLPPDLASVTAVPPIAGTGGQVDATFATFVETLGTAAGPPADVGHPELPSGAAVASDQPPAPATKPHMPQVSSNVDLLQLELPADGPPPHGAGVQPMPAVVSFTPVPLTEAGEICPEGEVEEIATLEAGSAEPAPTVLVAAMQSPEPTVLVRLQEKSGKMSASQSPAPVCEGGPANADVAPLMPTRPSEALSPNALSSPPADKAPPTPPLAQPGTPATAMVMQAPTLPQAVPQALPIATPTSLNMAAPTAGPKLSLRSEFGDRFGIVVARHLNVGKEEVHLRMEPAELGRVDVKLSFDDDGHLRAMVHADSGLVVDAIRRDLGDITRALADAGVRTDGQSFRFERGGGQPGGGETNAGGGGSGRGSPDQQRHSQGGHQQHEQPAHPIRGNGRLDLVA